MDNNCLSCEDCNKYECNLINIIGEMSLVNDEEAVAARETLFLILENDDPFRILIEYAEKQDFKTVEISLFPIDIKFVAACYLYTALLQQETSFSEEEEKRLACWSETNCDLANEAWEEAAFYVTGGILSTNRLQ